ncbi:hypothetical protein PHJA_000414500 [Phtheirospermum japonicum]|uniref:Senescence regulator n=1 Tax=Phtheirospermum japonicum TaxID=374723 RepID=A0A830BD47_9LAMI|nr:hypothetical protein PHJA_000414500 [Phtheirospermum japonicum]
MDQNNATGYRHRRSPSSDRFIGVFSPPSTAATISSSSAAGDELSELDVFYTADFSEPPRAAPSPAAVDHRYRHSFLKSEKYGILAALPEDRRSADSIVQKPSLPSSPTTTTSFGRDIPSIPKPHSSSEISKYSQSMPIRRFQQSAPVKIPMMPRKPRNSLIGEVDVGDDDDEEVLPPHEIVARGSMRDRTTTFSVLEGVGRTLKGRDLRQVRNAVWRQTGFLD